MNKTVTQQQLFCKGLLIGAKSDNPMRQKETITVNLNKNIIEVNNNCNGFIVYRVNDGLWSSWTSKEEISNTFKQLLN